MAKRSVEDGKGDLKREKESVWKVFEAKDQARLCIKRIGVYSRDPRSRDPFSAPVPKMETHSWKKRAMCDTLLSMVDYYTTGDIACQHSGWTNVMTNTPQEAREEALYWSKETERREKRAT